MGEPTRGAVSLPGLGVTFDTHHLGKEYPTLLRRLRLHGALVTGRGGATREFIDYTLALSDPRNSIVSRHGASDDFLLLEITMLLAGVYRQDRVESLIPRAAELVTPLTAYGPRIREQMPRVLRELRMNPLSRRAVVYIGKKDDLRNADHPGATGGEMPCTCLWQFLVRDSALHMLVYMRSWDAVWGLTYDVPCFAAVQIAVARDLGLALGTYRHHAGSFHLYERHWEITATPCDASLEPLLGDVLCDTYAETQARALEMLGYQRAST